MTHRDSVSANAEPLAVVGVLDILGGRTVRAVGGRRDEYRPLSQTLGDRDDAVADEPCTRARRLAERFGLRKLYIADLDAILHARPNEHALDEVAGEYDSVMLDLGVRDVAATVRVAARWPTWEIVIALETWTNCESLSQVVAEIDPRRIWFSVDLRDGVPQRAPHSDWPHTALDIVAAAQDAGIRQFVILDLKAVGERRGVPTNALCRSIRHNWPATRLATGGGVRGLADLEALAQAGVCRALVGTALHDGSLTPADLQPYRI